MTKPVQLVVDSRIRMLRRDLPLGAEEELQAEFTHLNPQHDKLVALGYKAWREPKRLMTWKLEGSGASEQLTLPRGGMGRVREIFTRLGIDWLVEDMRVEGDPEMRGKIPAHRIKLYDFQERMVEAAVRRENCLLRSGTGSGKTCAAIGIAARLELPTLVVVWNGALLNQWQRRLEAELGLSSREVGLVRGPIKRLRPVTMAMQQTLWRMRGAEWEWLDRAFGVVIGDEIQRCPARTVLDVFDRLSARYRIGISASERRKDGKEFLTYDVFGGVEVEVDEAELVRKGVVHEVEVRVVPTEFECPEYAEAREAFARVKTSGAQGEDADAPDFKLLLDKMVANERRNLVAMGLALEEIGAGNPTIAFSHRREHCQRLCAIAAAGGIKSGLLLGTEEDAAEFERSAAGLRSREVMFAAGTIQAVGQGIDLPAVSRGIVATPVAGNKYLWGQVKGRLCRIAEGKADAVVYYLWDQRCVGLGHLANLVAWNRSVLVLDRGMWVEGREFLRAERARMKEERDGEATK